LKCFAVLYANEHLDFTRLTGLFAKLENICRHLSCDLSGRQPLTVPSLFDKREMQTQANEKVDSVSVGLKHRRRRSIQSHCLQHLRDAGATAFRETEFFQKFADAPIAMPARRKTPGSQFLNAGLL
jgi:hypothetical protein